MFRTIATAILATVVVALGPSVTAAGAQTGNIVRTAAAAGSFTTLAKALEAADLVSTLEGTGPFTVFAPTDEAFAKLPAGALATLLKPENKAQLRRILTYHVVAGQVMAADVMKMHSAKTVSGEMLTVAAKPGGVMVDKAHVIKADVAASNGVIHVIDAVLMPKGE